MKSRIAVVHLFLLLPTLLLAQNFSVFITDSAKTGQPGDEIIFEGIIVNLTNEEIPLKMTRLTNEIPDDWTTALCFVNCAPPWIDVIEGSVAANDTLEFSVHFFTSQAPNQGQAQIEISQPKAQADTFLFKASTMEPSHVQNFARSNISYKMLQNYPNPFNSQTKIRFFAAPSIRKVKFTVFSIRGKMLYENWHAINSSGIQEILFSAQNIHGGELTNGIYVYRLDFFDSEKIVDSLISRLILIK